MPLQLRGTVPVRGTANESVVEYSRCSNHERSKDPPRKPRPGWGFRSCALAFADYRAGPFGRLRKGNQARSSQRAERPNGPSVRTMTLWSQICKQSWSQKSLHLPGKHGGVKWQRHYGVTTGQDHSLDPIKSRRRAARFAHCSESDAGAMGFSFLFSSCLFIFFLLTA